MKISYAITVCNELEEIMRLLDLLLKNKQKQDEIVVLIDTVKANEQLTSTLRHYEMHNMDHMVVWPGEFEGHFANWKNKLTSYCSGDYIFFLDADEIPSEDLIQTLPEILEINPEMDTFLVPRINTVDGITSEHIANWGWNVTKLDSVIGEKILDLSNPKDLKEYEFLKECDLIIEESIYSK
jgi:cellulose synthase/poly-beta-1,6-N-acetylglucosamine synthase-like glycosyltransferase